MAEKIDELQLGISSDAQSAIDQLGRLANALGKAAEKADLLSQKATGVNNFVTGLKNLTDTDTEKLKTVTSRLRSLSKIDLSNIADKNIDIGVSVNGSTDAVESITNVTKALKQAASGGGGAKATLSNNMLGEGLKAGLQGATNAAKTLFSWSLKLGGQGASALGSFMGRLGLIPNHTANINKMSLSFGNLLKTVLPFVGLRGVFGWLKESVDLGSSIVEIQNVIDTAFGSLRKGYDSVSGHIYNWSKTTMDAFGVSEIAALRYAGRLQSIFNSSGFDVSESMRNSASQMTTDLIERAGDIASFYDISVDEAMTKMQAGLVGMVRPMRALGVNMSVANMEAFALSQGIQTSWKEMDQASQMALRYQYILSATQYAEGDFQRTSRSLANEMRLLTLNTQMLSTTIGQGLVSAIAPVIGWLNALIKRLIQAATAFRTFMWTLFGKPIAAAKGVADDLLGSLDDSADAVGDLGGGAGGASDGLGSAGKAAKDLKKQLSVLPFDELNQLAKDTDSAASGGSGGSGGGGGGGGLGGLSDLGLEDLSDIDIDSSPTVQAINRWAAEMREAFEKHQWKKLGAIVARGINDGFQYIYDVLDWNKIKPIIVDKFIHPFQEFFNSMMLNIKWDLIGRTFARGLNIIVYTLREWINGFEWHNFGTYFATGLNGMLDEWDADAFGRLIADKFKAAWDFFGGWVETFHFSDLGTKLKELVLGGIDELDPKDMGKSLAGFANGIADTLIEMLGDKQVKDELASAFSEFVNGFLEEFDEEDASYALQLVGDTIFGGLAKALDEVDKSEFVYKLATVLSSLPWASIAAIIGAKAGASLALGIFGTAFKLKAASIIAGINVGGATGGASGAASAASSGAGGAASSGLLSGLSTLSVGTIAVGGSIMLGALALGTWLNKWTQEHGGVEQFHGQNLAPSHQQSNQPQQPQTKQNAAGYSTQIQTVTLKGKTDPSFTSTLADKAQLFKDPTALKTMNGKETSDFITARNNFHGIVSNTQTKTVNGFRTAEFNNTRTLFHGIVSNTQTKTVDGSRTSAFNTTRSYFHDVVSGWATKTADGYRTGAFKTAYSDYMDLHDKDVTVSVDVDIDTAVTEVVADIEGAASRVVASFWTRTRKNAKGGLFTGATGFQVFGEAGMEAAIPLERKSTMQKIANAIVDSGGMSTGSSSELADEIALRIAPIVMSAVTGQNERPINVNATLYTENNEVLARAVNQGNRSLDKRYNPVAQFSY